MYKIPSFMNTFLEYLRNLYNLIIQTVLNGKYQIKSVLDSDSESLHKSLKINKYEFLRWTIE